LSYRMYTLTNKGHVPPVPKSIYNFEYNGVV